MFTSKFDTRSSLTFGFAAVALAISTASPFAYADTVDQTATAAQQQKMAACKSEFSSLHDICLSEAGWGLPVTRKNLSQEELRMLDSEESRYRMAVASCNGLLGNNRPICVSRAGMPSSLSGMN